MGGTAGAPTGNKVLCNIDIGGEMKYECGVGGSKAGIGGESLVSFVHSYSRF